MIKKLKTPKTINWDDTPEGLIQRHRLITDAYEKINEIINYINQNNHEYASIEEVVKARENHIANTSKNIDAGELAFLSKENSNLKDELERTRKALDCAINTLETVYGMSEDASNIETYVKCKRIEINGIIKGYNNE